MFCIQREVGQRSENYRANEVYKNTDKNSQNIAHLPPQSRTAASLRSAPSPLPAGASEASRNGLAVRRMTPILPRRTDASRQLAEFVSNAAVGGNVSSSSLSEGSSVQTPVLSRNSSKNSSMSDEAQNLQSGQFASSDLSLDNDTCSVHSVPGMLSRLPLGSSETNLAGGASATMPRSHSHHRHVDHSVKSQQVTKPAVNSAEYAQQLRRRSRSAENLNQRSQQSSQDTWSTVDIDINGQQNEEASATITNKQLAQSRSKSALGQRIVDGMPPVFNAIRLRPFRQQMNNIVVRVYNLCYIFHVC